MITLIKLMMGFRVAPGYANVNTGTGFDVCILIRLCCQQASKSATLNLSDALLMDIMK